MGCCRPLGDYCRPYFPNLLTLTLSGRLYNGLYTDMAERLQLLFLTTCSDDSKPYMILKALDESYKNHIGFAIIRASDEEW
jgi:hypothetical protein